MNLRRLKPAVSIANFKGLNSVKPTEYTEQPLPSTGTMAKNVAKSLFNNVKSVVKGNAPIIGDDEAARRLEICQACRFYRKSDNRCSKCGCALAVKTHLKAEHCPISKW